MGSSPSSLSMLIVISNLHVCQNFLVLDPTLAIHTHTCHCGLGRTHYRCPWIDLFCHSAQYEDDLAITLILFLSDSNVHSNIFISFAAMIPFFTVTCWWAMATNMVWQTQWYLLIDQPEDPNRFGNLANFGICLPMHSQTRMQHTFATTRINKLYIPGDRKLVLN